MAGCSVSSPSRVCFRIDIFGLASGTCVISFGAPAVARAALRRYCCQSCCYALLNDTAVQPLYFLLLLLLPLLLLFAAALGGAQEQKQKPWRRWATLTRTGPRDQNTPEMSNFSAWEPVWQQLTENR